MMLRVLDLFSGIGGFSLGLERTGGFRTVAFCEIEPFARRVLAKHWPEVPCYDDVRTLTAERLAADGISVDVICGGFPCQDISLAGKGAGLAGERSGLWREYARLVGELRPSYVIVENVAALLGRGLGDVLGDMASLGYDAEWHCIPASAVGAPHRRDRLWIVGYPTRQHGEVPATGLQPAVGKPGGHGAHWASDDVADAAGAGRRAGLREAGQGGRRPAGLPQPVARDGRAPLAYPGRPRLPLSQQAQRGISLEAARHEWGSASECGWWSVEPDVGRMAHGVPARVDRLRGLGNAVVPQIPELIGRAILAAEAA